MSEAPPRTSRGIGGRARAYRRAGGTSATCPESAWLLALLGGESHGAVTLTGDEVRALERLYGEVVAPSGPAAAFERAGNMRNLFRAAERDGLRVVAFLARHMAPGDDPVRFVAELLAEAGADVGTAAHFPGEGEEGP